MLRERRSSVQSGAHCGADDRDGELSVVGYNSDSFAPLTMKVRIMMSRVCSSRRSTTSLPKPASATQASSGKDCNSHSHFTDLQGFRVLKSSFPGFPPHPLQLLARLRLLRLQEDVEHEESGAGGEDVDGGDEATVECSLKCLSLRRLKISVSRA